MADKYHSFLTQKRINNRLKYSMKSNLPFVEKSRTKLAVDQDVITFLPRERRFILLNWIWSIFLLTSGRKMELLVDTESSPQEE